MRSCRWGNSQCAVPGKMLHGVRGRVQRVELRGLHLEAGLHPLPQLPLPDLSLPDLPLPQLPFPDGGVHVVEAGHVVGQERVGGVQGDEEGMVPVRWRHDVRTGVLAQRPQGRCVRADVGRDGSDGRRRGLKRRPHVCRPAELRLPEAAFVGGAGYLLRSSFCFSFTLTFPLSFLLFFLLSLPLFSGFLLRFPFGLFNGLFSLLGQFGSCQRHEVQICS